VSPGPDGTYFYDANGLIFHIADLLTVFAAGGEVPAFGRQNIPAPGPFISLTTPVIDVDAGTYALSTSQDLSLAWTGSQGGSSALFEARGQSGAGELVVLQCLFPPSMQTGTIPRGALAALSGLTQGVFSWGQSIGLPFTAGAWTVSFSAANYDSVPATFQ
jgi:hypothetical protein